MRDKNTTPESEQDKRKLYSNSAICALVNETMQNIAAVQTKYPLDPHKKNIPHEMTAEMIRIFTNMLRKTVKLVSYFDNHKSPGALEYPGLGVLGLKIYALEKQIFSLKTKIDLNPHPMYIEFFQVLAAIFERVPENFEEMIPFIKPSLIDFNLGQANYEASLATYQEMIFGVLESHQKMNDLDAKFKTVTTTTSGLDDDVLREEEWVNFEPVHEATAQDATAEKPPSINFSIRQTVWSKSETSKPTSDCADAYGLR